MKVKKIKFSRKAEALFQIGIFLISIFALSYLLGSEIGFVSAVRGGFTRIPVNSAVGKALGGGANVATKTPFSWQGVLNGLGQIAINAAIAYGLYVGTKWLLSLLPGAFTPEAAQAAGIAIGLGYGIGSTAITITGLLFPTLFANLFTASIFGGLIGIGVGLILFLFLYKDQAVGSVVFTCFSWSPAVGGEFCNICTSDGFPCSEYKCKSLGTQCELLNPGTGEELCAMNDTKDIVPPTVEAWEGALLEYYRYVPRGAILPPDRGVTVEYTKKSGESCIPAFTTFTFGVKLDKPGRCRADVLRKDNFSSMSIELSSGRYKYNHTISSVIPDLAALRAEGIDVGDNGIYEIYVRCESTGGYSNVGTFGFRYCLQEYDITAPSIMTTDPLNNMPVAFGQGSLAVNFYVNKPSTCRWSRLDEDYNNMKDEMSCASSITEMNANMFYKCTTTLTGIKDRTENKFYIRCKSYPLKPEEERYVNTNSYEYTLIGTQPLVIDWLKPTGTVKDSVEDVKVTLEAQTSAGYKDGEAKCYFSKTAGVFKSSDLFMNTGTYQHSQDLWLTAGNYKYFIKCCDLGNNCQEGNVEFRVETDFNPPIIVRAYYESGSLKIVTNEDAECAYSITDCSYILEDGITFSSGNDREHSAGWDTTNNYYIKCKDDYGNQPSPADCTMTIRPFELY
ncbi:MAG: hypothetical protein NTU63_02170 [Candidatus Pacearchaeota archaeon]|nr:hypothetical protein [Candidatus Pacearchaeota archaeon]